MQSMDRKSGHRLLWPILIGAVAATALHAADPAGSGPEPAIVYSADSLPTHTIYRPENLQGQYPVVLWGNGSCIDSNFGYRDFLAEIASHGFIILAIGPYRDSPAPRQPRPDDPAEWPPFETHYSQMFDGLDWITAENEQPGSPFEDESRSTKWRSSGTPAVACNRSKPRLTTVSRPQSS